MAKPNSMSVLLILIVAMMGLVLYMITVMSFKAEREGHRPRSRHFQVSPGSLGETQELFVRYERSYAVEQAENTKVGIVAMVTCSPGFEFWLKFHLDYLKMDLVVLRVEDCPSHRALVEPYGSRVSYVSQQGRYRYRRQLPLDDAPSERHSVAWIADSCKRK